MSECAGPNCTHPDCVDARHTDPPMSVLRERMERLREIPAAKLETMNRAQRRAAMKGRKGA